MRLFISIEISNNLKDKIVELQKRFAKSGVNLVKKDNLHFCIMFLGDVEEEQLNEIKKAIEGVARIYKKFEINISDIGAFPNKNYINVLFLEVREGRQQMLGIAKSLRYELSGFRSGKPFVPHLTLARVKTGNEELKELVAKLEKIEIGKMVADKLVLIESTLTSQGPIYKEIYSINLGI